MDSGLQGGILGTDKAADAFKEFRVRIQDGSKTTADGLAAIGLDAGKMADQFASGSLSAADAFQLVVDRIGETEDKNKAFQAGVALMGSQYEDLGEKAAAALTLSGTKMEDLTGAADQAATKFDTIGQAASAAFNSILAAFADTDALDPISDAIGAKFKKLAQAFPEALSGADFDGLNDALMDVIGQAEALVSDFFGGVDLSTPEGMADAIQTVVDALEGFETVTGGVMDGFGPLVDLLGDAVEFFSDLSPEAQAAVGVFLALATQANLVGGAVSAAGGAIGGIGTALGGLSSAGGTVVHATGKIVEFTKTLQNNTKYLGLFQSATGNLSTALGAGGLVLAAGAAGVAIGTLINQIPGVQDTVQGVIAEVDNFLGGVFSAGPTLDEMAKIDDALFAAKEQAKRLREEAEKTGDSIEKIPGEKEVKISADTDEANKKLEETNQYVGYLSDDQFKNIAIGVDYDEQGAIQEIDQAKADFMALDGTTVKFVGKADTAEAKQAIEELVPPDKRLELQVDLEMAEIEADADKFKAEMEAMQTAVEWQAKLDIAEAEANAKQVEAAFASISASIESTGDVLSGLFSMLGEDLGFQEKWAVFDQIEKENELREKAIKMQETLVNAQTAALEKWAARLDSNTPIKLSIDGGNLSAHLEAIWAEIIEALQDQAVMDGGEMLIGMLPTAS
jgi:hypothetical protein